MGRARTPRAAECSAMSAPWPGSTALSSDGSRAPYLAVAAWAWGRGACGAERPVTNIGIFLSCVALVFHHLLKLTE